MIPESRKFGKLDVFFEQDSTVPLVYVFIDILCGSECDPESKCGISRLAANMLKMGTKNRTREELNTSIEVLGADFDITAGHHHISITGSVIKESVGEFSELIREILYETGLRKEDFKKLQRETIAEIIERRDDDQGVAYRNFRKLLFGNHPYSRSSLGTPQEIEAITFAEMVEWFEKLIYKSRIIFGCAGDIGFSDATEMFAKFIERLSSMELNPPNLPPPSKPEGIKIRLVDKPDRVQSQIYMGHIGPDPRSDVYFPAVILNTAFGGTFTARLSQEIRKKRGMSYGAYSRILRSRTKDAFFLWTFPSAKDTARCIRTQLEMLRDLKENGITEDEFEFAVKYLTNHFLFAIETAPMRVALKMKEISNELPDGFFENYRESIKKVTFEDVNRVANSFIDPENMCICVLCSADHLQKEVETELKEFSPVIEVVPYDEE